MAIPGPDPKILDDLARVAGGAVNIMSGFQEQIRADMRARMEDMAERLDLVPRSDLDRALGMIAKLEQRVAALEGSKAKKTATKKPDPKKPVAKKPTKTIKKTAKKK